MASNSGKTDLHIGFQIKILLSSSQWMIGFWSLLWSLLTSKSSILS